MWRQPTFLEGHPFVTAISNSSFIKDSQEKIEKSSSGYYITSRRWNPIDVMTTINEAEQFIGSYTYYGKVNDDRSVLYNIVYDSKSRTSLFYHLGIENKERNQVNTFGNTYQFYIWKKKL